MDLHYWTSWYYFCIFFLRRCSAAPCFHQLELALHLFGYLKKYPNQRVVLDLRPLMVNEEFVSAWLLGWLCEDVDDTMWQAHGKALTVSVFFDADRPHDHVTRRSISGIWVCSGSTLVIRQSKRQGCIATSAYYAEFIAMRPAVEEAISFPMCAPMPWCGRHETHGIFQRQLWHHPVCWDTGRRTFEKAHCYFFSLCKGGYCCKNCECSLKKFQIYFMCCCGAHD